MVIGRPSQQRRVVLRRRNTVVGGKCALPSAVLVNLLSCFSCLEFEGDGQNMSITVKLEAWTFEAYAIKIVPKAPRGALRWTRCLCTVGQVVHTLLDGEPVLGIASLAGEIYVLRDKERDQVEVYDVITYRLQRCLTVSDAGELADMTSCEHCRCLYFANFSECVHRLDLQGAATKWAVSGRPCALSVNAEHNLLATCLEVRKIKEFSSHGDLLRELTLPDDVVNPWHAIELTSGQFIVCHVRWPC